MQNNLIEIKMHLHFTMKKCNYISRAPVLRLGIWVSWRLAVESLGIRIKSYENKAKASLRGLRVSSSNLWQKSE